MSGSANYDIYEELWREENMCEVLERLMKDEIDKKCNEARYEGKREGKRLREIEAVKSIMKKLSYTAEQAMDLLEISESQRKVMMKNL